MLYFFTLKQQNDILFLEKELAAGIRLIPCSFFIVAIMILLF